MTVRMPPPMYLTSAEVKHLCEPRLCTFVAIIPGETRDDWYVVDVSPPLDASELRVGAGAIDVVLLASRHVGHPIFPAREWPVHVYVVHATNPAVFENQFLRADHSAVAAWGVLFRTYQEARAFSEMWW